jgi:hypothetical protein
MEGTPKPFDRKTWDALLQIDPEIAAAATYLRGFGARYVDDLADSYLAIGEKRYLATIVAKIARQAEEEPDLSTSSEKFANAAIASARPPSTSRVAPQFDADRWNTLALEDSDIAAAIAEVGIFGRHCAADLASSYQAIDDKKYLRRIVDTIVAEAKAQRANAAENVYVRPWGSRHPPGASTAAGDPPEKDEIPQAGADSSIPPPSTSNLRRKLGVAALGAVALLLTISTAATLYDYSMFRSAHNDTNRLQAYRANSDAIRPPIPI